MKIEEAKRLSLELLSSAEAAYIATVDRDCSPHIRAICNFRNKEHYPEISKLFDNHQDDFLLYFITNTSSKKMAHIKANPAVSIYYCNPQEFNGLMLSGKTEIVADPEIKKALWHEGCEIHYPKGVDDPEYAVLKLVPTFAKGWYQYGPFEFEIKGK